MGYNFKIKYTQGKESRATDELYRKMNSEEDTKGLLTMIRFPTPDWIRELRKSYSLSTEFMNLLTKFQNKQEVPKGVTV